jgi:hypothetical protein
VKGKIVCCVAVLLAVAAFGEKSIDFDIDRKVPK